MRRSILGEQKPSTPQTIMAALRAARQAITDVGRRQQAAPVADAELKFRNADLVRVIESGAEVLTRPYIVELHHGGLAFRQGTNPLHDQGPRARLVQRLQFEALKAAGITDEY